MNDLCLVNPSAKMRNSNTIALALLAAFVLIAFMLTSAYLSRRTQIHLFCKDRFAPLEDRGECCLTSAYKYHFLCVYV